MGSTLDLQVLLLVLFCVSACLSKLLFLDWFAQRPLKQQGERGLRASAWAPGPQGPGRMAARPRCSLGRREPLMGSVGPLPSSLDTAAFPGLSGCIAQFSLNSSWSRPRTVYQKRQLLRKSSAWTLLPASRMMPLPSRWAGAPAA